MPKSLRLYALTTVASLLYIVFLTTYALSQPAVKLSRSGICHATDSQYYNRTKNYQSFSNLTECLKHGRLPKNYTPGPGIPVAPEQQKTNQNTLVESEYDRDKFGSWIDEDGDCQNTRHELLAVLSTGTPVYDSSGCRVVRGRWLDPYTEKVFLEAKNLDVDHLVPLKWAWDHGANNWSESKRRTFANDMRNLFAVKASVNRQKGAKGPITWLPPNQKFRCEYITRFKRIMLTYDLKLSTNETAQFETVFNRECG